MRPLDGGSSRFGEIRCAISIILEDIGVEIEESNTYFQVKKTARQQATTVRSKLYVSLLRMNYLHIRSGGGVSGLERSSCDNEYA